MKDDSDIIKVLKSSNMTPSEKVNVITEINNKQHSKSMSASTPISKTHY